MNKMFLICYIGNHKPEEKWRVKDCFVTTIYWRVNIENDCLYDKIDIDNFIGLSNLENFLVKLVRYE